jgi:uncharacterized membrane protein
LRKEMVAVSSYALRQRRVSITLMISGLDQPALAAHLANARSLEDGVRKGQLFVFESFQKIDAT